MVDFRAAHKGAAARKPIYPRSMVLWFRSQKSVGNIRRVRICESIHRGKGTGMTDTNRQFVLARHPDGELLESDFKWQEGPIPEPGPGEVLTRTLYLSLDPANRSWINKGGSYRDPVVPGQVMPGFTISRVVASRYSGLDAGDIVESESGWQDFACLRGDDLYRLDADAPLELWMNVLGLTGKTAYFGLLDIGQPQVGETVVVSGAAGATGSVAGQIAKIKGCRVIGIAGSQEKCDWVRNDLGFDEAIDYKRQDMAEGLRAACPDGIDIYFDNVGGATLQAALLQMRRGGRIVCCGAVSQYDKAKRDPSPAGIPGLLIVRRLKMQGFIVMDHYGRRREAERELLHWVREGRIKYRLDIVDGLENAPRALIGLLHGDNVGKRMIRVAAED